MIGVPMGAVVLGLAWGAAVALVIASRPSRWDGTMYAHPDIPADARRSLSPMDAELLLRPVAPVGVGSREEWTAWGAAARELHRILTAGSSIYVPVPWPLLIATALHRSALFARGREASLIEALYDAQVAGHRWRVFALALALFTLTLAYV